MLWQITVYSHLYALWPDRLAGVDMLPVAFSVSALLISWIIFAEVYRQMAERTAALERSVERLSAEIGRRTQLEADLRELVASSAVRQERRRLARDLHDSVTQSLHSLVLSAETAGALRGAQPERLEQTLAHLAVSARQALKEMRLLLYELRLGSPFEAGLAQALQTRLDAVERRAGVQSCLVVGEGAIWPKLWDRELYPIAMEALNNALKHARATSVEVRLRGGRDAFAMHICDDGRGFDPPDARANGGLGLSTMAERAERLGGRLVVSSAPGRGTRVSFLKGEVSDADDPGAGGRRPPDDA